MSNIEKIPQPPEIPFLGNRHNLEKAVPLRSQKALMKQYGRIFRLRLADDTIFIGAQEYVNQVCDESKFEKAIQGSLLGAKDGMGDGLFTAYSNDPQWHIAHRILIPALGPLAIRGMFPNMLDIACQLAAKWYRFGPGAAFTPTDDFTRMTLDTIALCTFNYRLNSFYHDELHPFVIDMIGFLSMAGTKHTRIPLPYYFNRAYEDKYWGHVKGMHDIVDEIIAAREKETDPPNDLLDAMLKGKDIKTGEGLSAENIRYQIVTFLIAGHETTSGMLSFAFYYLLQNPHAYRKVQEEVDRVIGFDNQISVDHLAHLPYIDAVLKEALRLQPLAGAFTTKLKEDQEPFILSGKYRIEKHQMVQVVLNELQRDPKVWGEDAEEFKPERMLDGKFEALPPNSWKPFGNGMRSCIGRQFAFQEALLVVAILFQNFEFRNSVPNYQLELVQQLTIKPKDFQIHATPRKGASLPFLTSTAASLQKEQQKTAEEALNTHIKGAPLSIFFGSNTGTCQSLSLRVAAKAGRYGFHANVEPLDSACGKLPTDHPVIIITASYEGQPPDNAGIFVKWLESLKEKELENVKYVVFGCGHHDWASTYQRVPTLCDKLMEERGAERIVARGQGDAGGHDLFGEFEAWETESLWPSLKRFSDTSFNGTSTAALDIKIIRDQRPEMLRQDVHLARVCDTKILTAAGEPVKRHLEIELPKGSEYSPGDYLAILPRNPVSSVFRTLRRLGLDVDTHLVISSSSFTTLPTDRPIEAFELFSGYVEVGQPATKQNILALGSYSSNAADQAELEALSKELDASAEKRDRLSVLELLEKYSSIDIPVQEFLAMMPPMKLRQYSVSSSSLWNPDRVTLTVSVIKGSDTKDQPSRTGVASSYLDNLEVGDSLRAGIRKAPHFRLPLDPTVPIIMVCAGSGIAPFRGFIQERAYQIKSGRKVGKAVLFFGCRSPTKDQLYKDELAEWVSIGAVKVYNAYSRDPGASDGCKYVQARLWKERKTVKELFDAGGKVFVCGTQRVGTGVWDAFARIHQETEYADDEQTKEWMDSIRKDRYATDIFD